MSINRVMITGNLTREPDLRATANGTSILNLGIAVNDRRRNAQTGQWEDVPNFVNCFMFGARAASVSRYLNKGSKVAIDGSLRYSSWVDKQTGTNRNRLEVVINDIELMSRRSQEAPADTPVGNVPSQPATSDERLYGADIPF